MKLSLSLLKPRFSATAVSVALSWILSGLVAGSPMALPAEPEGGEASAAVPSWIGLDAASADGNLLPLSDAEIGASRDAGGGGQGLQAAGFRRSFNIPIPENQFFLLYASRAAGTVVEVQFVGSMNTNGDDMDAADARFGLVDLVKGTSWSVTGADLGWSGQGAFGPSRSAPTQVFNGSLELDTDDFYYWESVNYNGGCAVCNATFNGEFIVTVEYPSPVALTAFFAVEEPDASGWVPRDSAYSYVANPAFTLDYVYDESYGYWSEQPYFQCYDGDVNPTNFYLGIFNLTGKPVQACTFQASWDAQQHQCSQAILDVLNHPTNSRSFLIRTEDYVYVPDAACQVFTPTTVHALPGVLHWMWAEFIIDGVSYERRMYFVKQ